MEEGSLGDMVVEFSHGVPQIIVGRSCVGVSAVKQCLADCLTIVWVVDWVHMVEDLEVAAYPFMFVCV